MDRTALKQGREMVVYCPESSKNMDRTALKQLASLIIVNLQCECGLKYTTNFKESCDCGGTPIAEGFEDKYDIEFKYYPDEMMLWYESNFLTPAKLTSWEELQQIFKDDLDKKK